MNPHKCPECGAYDTQKQMTDFHSDAIEVVRTCNECPTQFVVNYGDPRVIDVTKYESYETN